MVSGHSCPLAYPVPATVMCPLAHLAPILSSVYSAVTGTSNVIIGGFAHPILINPISACGDYMKTINVAVVDACIERGYKTEEIFNMSPKELFEEYCCWHGLINWSDTLFDIVIDLEKSK